LRLARANREPRKGLCPLQGYRVVTDASVSVSDGGGSPPTFTVAMLALTPDAVDVHPFSVALLDVARVAAGLGHSSGASGAACDAMLVDVTVRRIHKRQYITAAPLSRAHAYPCAVRRTITLVHGPLSREALLSFRVWTQTSLGDQARLDLRNAGLGSVKRIRVRVHGVGAQTRARNGAGRPNPGRIRCRLELGTRSPPPMARTPRGLRRAMARRSPPPRCRWRPSTPSPARVEPLALND